MSYKRLKRLTQDELLVLLIEECGEVIQAATKCLRFGYTKEGPKGYGRNDIVLSSEIGDVLGVVDELPLVQRFVNGCRAAKMEKARIAKAVHGKKP